MIAKRFLLLITLIVIGLAPALRADPGCAATTMSGAYGFSGNGFEIVHKSGSQTGQPELSLPSLSLAPFRLPETECFLVLLRRPATDTRRPEFLSRVRMLSMPTARGRSLWLRIMALSRTLP